jgi:hypothetical protein
MESKNAIGSDFEKVCVLHFVDLRAVLIHEADWQNRMKQHHRPISRSEVYITYHISIQTPKLFNAGIDPSQLNRDNASQSI